MGVEWLRRITQGIILLIWASAWGIALWRQACFGEDPTVPIALNVIFALALGIVSGKDLVAILQVWWRKRNNNA